MSGYIIGALSLVLMVGACATDDLTSFPSESVDAIHTFSDNKLGVEETTGRQSEIALTFVCSASCDDDNVCTKDVCDKVVGECVHLPIAATEVYTDLLYYEIAECDAKSGWSVYSAELFASNGPAVTTLDNKVVMEVAVIMFLQKQPDGTWQYVEIAGDPVVPGMYPDANTMSNICQAYSAEANSAVLDDAPVQFSVVQCTVEDGVPTQCVNAGDGKDMKAWIGNNKGEKKIPLKLEPIQNFVDKSYHSPDLDAFCKKGLGAK